MEEAIHPDHIADDTPADNLVGTYEFLSEFSMKTSCFYRENPERYIRESLKYKIKAKEWNGILGIAL